MITSECVDTRLIDQKPFSLKTLKKTTVMGVINLTPDSFSHDGRLQSSTSLESNLRLAKKMVRDGADIIDIGGESTRPGANKISVEEEVQRVIPTLKLLVRNLKIPVSIDTYKSKVAQHALDCGASIVNNIRGVKENRALLKMVKSYDAGIVLMHIRGTPRTMQRNVEYSNIIDDIFLELQNSIEKCLEIGIKHDKIIVDPGIGFGKNVEQNLLILKHLKKFKLLNVPILVGTSRKSFIGKTLDLDVKNRLIGTLATLSASVLNGADIVRVHDVKQARQTVNMIDAIQNSD